MNDIKSLFPGTLGDDVEAMLHHFLFGVGYESKKLYEDVGSLQVPFGQVSKSFFTKISIYRSCFSFCFFFNCSNENILLIISAEHEQRSLVRKFPKTGR